MNHDVSHCSDYNPDTCPKSCFRAQVTADLFARSDLVGLPFSFMSFHKNGDPECPLAPSYAPAKPESWGEYIRSADDADLVNLFWGEWRMCPGNEANHARCKKFATCLECWAAFLKEVVE